MGDSKNDRGGGARKGLNEKREKKNEGKKKKRERKREGSGHR